MNKELEKQTTQLFIKRIIDDFKKKGLDTEILETPYFQSMSCKTDAMSFVIGVLFSRLDKANIKIKDLEETLKGE